MAHVMHVLCASVVCTCGMHVRCAYEVHVRGARAICSAANVSDMPSRVDLSGVVWDCGLPGAGLVSAPVPALLPAERDWADRAAEWVLRARRRALEGGGRAPALGRRAGACTPPLGFVLRSSLGCGGLRYKRVF